jgi:hypothetical protein
MALLIVALKTLVAPMKWQMFHSNQQISLLELKKTPPPL